MSSESTRRTDLFEKRAGHAAAAYARRLREQKGVPEGAEPFIDALDTYIGELRRLMGAVCELTGVRPGRRELARAINDSGRASLELARFTALRRGVPPVVSGSIALAVTNAYAYMEPLEWAGRLSELNRELASRRDRGTFFAKATRPRVLVTGSPIAFPNFKVPLIVEEMGGVIVADGTCFGERGLTDPIVVTDETEDGLLRAIASRSLLPCPCPAFADNEARIARLKAMVRASGAQGVIYHVLRGCLTYDYEYRAVEAALSDIDVPVIRVESDYNEEDVEQLRIRVEAFVEMMKMREWERAK